MSKNKRHTEPSILSYRSEEDRSYGLAGMTIALAGLDAMDTVVRVSLDEQGPMVLFSNEFYWGTSQAASPKAHWHILIRNFRITTSLALANILSRSLAKAKGIDTTQMLHALYPVIETEGREVCQLETDEVKSFYERALMDSRRTFADPRLRPYVDKLAQVLTARRTLTGREIAEELHALHLI